MARTLALWDASFASSVGHVGRVVWLSGGFVLQRILTVTRRCGLAPDGAEFCAEVTDLVPESPHH